MDISEEVRELRETVADMRSTMTSLGIGPKLMNTVECGELLGVSPENKKKLSPPLNRSKGQSLIKAWTTRFPFEMSTQYKCR